MSDIIYSPIVQEKLKNLKEKLVDMCGETLGIKKFVDARTLFGIVTTTKESLDYWNE